MSERSTFSAAGRTSSARCHAAGMWRMCSCLLAFLLVGAASARTITVPPPAMPDYVDTEVSTNIALTAGLANTRGISMRFDLGGGDSNCVQVAFGRDANCDGVLSPDETAALYGVRAGRCFAEDMTAGVRHEEQICAGESFSVNMQISEGMALRAFSATHGTAPALADLSASLPAWLFSPDWNMARITRRGPGMPDEWLSLEVLSRFFVFTVR